MKVPFLRSLRIALVIAGASIATSSAHAQVCAPGDFNRDGKSDVFWQNGTSGQTVEWQMNGLTIGNSGSPATVADPTWKIVGKGDFDGDGKSDVLWWNNGSGQVVVFLMNGQTVTSSGSPGTVADTNWKVQGVGDFDGDGRADVLWQNRSTGQVVIWLMNGLSMVGSGSPNTVADLNWQVQATGDLNGDGKADILWQNRTVTTPGTGAVVAWLMNGLSLSSSGSPNTVADLNWQIQGAGDFDADGKSDLLWRNGSNGQTVVWLMNGLIVASSGSPGTVADLHWQIQGTGDYDANGKSDVFWRHIGAGGTGQTVVWLMNGTSMSISGSPNTVSDLAWNVLPAASLVAPCPALTPTVVASRTTGVAPLAVYFDATGTVATNPASKTFHDVEYRWDFGDAAGSPVSGTAWGFGSRPGADCTDPKVSCRNAATGPIAAHVFENFGTFTVTVTANDGSATAQRSVQVVVSDPDSLYAGANTICYKNAAGNVDAACPAGGTVIGSTTAFSTVKNSLGVNKRVLLKRGDTFTTALPNPDDDTGAINKNGPWTLGAYGSGAKPIVNATAANTYLLPLARTGPASDWRFMDLDVRQNGFSGVACSTAIGAGFAVSNLLYLRIDCSSTSGSGIGTYDQTGVFIVDSTINVKSYPHYTHGLTGSASLGSSFHTPISLSSTEHAWRAEHAVGLVVSNNLFDGGGTGGLGAGHLLKLHACSSNGSPGCGDTPADDSQKIVISDNKFQGNNVVVWDVAIGPQNSGVDERVSDVIVERNWWSSGGNSLQGLTYEGTKATIRNNLFEMTQYAAGNDVIGILVSQRGIEGTDKLPHITSPSDVRIYNNSFHSTQTSSNGATFHAIQIDSGTGMVVKNNVGYAPNFGSRTILQDNATATVKSNNSTNAQLATSPLFATMPPTTPITWKPTGASYAIGTNNSCSGSPCATSVPVWSDFFRVDEPTTRDLGAIIH